MRKIVIIGLIVGLTGCSIFKRDKEKDSQSTTESQASSSQATTTTTDVQSFQEPWSYEGVSAPEYWGDLKPEYITCKEGKEQSPVDLVYKKPKTNGRIITSYGPTNVRVIDTGRTIQVNFDPGNSVDIRGQKYELLQAQFHSSSEHTLSGNRLPMELQLLHRSEGGEMAILGVILIEGASHSLIESLWQNLPIQKGMEKDLNFKINPEDFLPKSRTYYTYQGSLTSPPCTEGVNWNVFNTPVTLSKEQIVSFRGIYPMNARPVQPLNGRKTVNYK